MKCYAANYINAYNAVANDIEQQTGPKEVKDMDHECDPALCRRDLTRKTYPCIIDPVQSHRKKLKFIGYYEQGDLVGGCYAESITRGRKHPGNINQQKFCFSYLDKNGLLCGCNLYQPKNNTKKFCLSHIKDCNEQPSKRQVTIISNLDDTANVKFEALSDSISTKIQETLNSELIYQLLNPIFSNEKVNSYYLNSFSKRLVADRNIDNYDVKHQLLTILENKILNDNTPDQKTLDQAFGDLAWSDDQFTQSLIKLFCDSPENITSDLIQETLKELTNQPYQSALAKIFSYQPEKSGDEPPSAVQHVIFIFLDALLNVPNLKPSALEEIVTSTTKYFNQASKEYNKLINQALNNTSAPTISLTNIARTSQNIEIAKLVLNHQHCTFECASNLRNNPNFTWKKHFSFKLKCFLAIYRKSILTYYLPAISSMYQLGAIYWIGLLQPQTLWTGIVSIIIVSLLTSTSYHSQQTYIVWISSLLMVCAQTALISFLPIPLTNIQMLSLILGPAFLCLFSYSLASSLLTIKLSENPTQSIETKSNETAPQPLKVNNNNEKSQSLSPSPAQ
jgi:hypothetical protein